MHLLVLSAFRLYAGWASTYGMASLNAPFGAQCFPTGCRVGAGGGGRVSMHLLVLSAFRLKMSSLSILHVSCLNAPFGAQCFPTREGLPGSL